MEDDSESSPEYGEEGVEKHLLLGDIQLKEKIGEGGQA
jgi:hypothetical protein